MAAVQFHKLCFHKLGWVVVPGNADSLSCRTDGFKHEVNDFVKTFPVKAVVLREYVILDIVLDDFTVNLYGTLF